MSLLRYSKSGGIFVYELPVKLPMIKRYHLWLTLIPWILDFTLMIIPFIYVF